YVATFSFLTIFYFFLQNVTSFLPSLYFRPLTNAPRLHVYINQSINQSINYTRDSNRYFALPCPVTSKWMKLAEGGKDNPYAHLSMPYTHTHTHTQIKSKQINFYLSCFAFLPVGGWG